MKGQCYWCNKIGNISSTPIAGIRICDPCLIFVGTIFLKNVEYLKTLEMFKSEKTTESIILIIAHLFGTYKEHFHIENERIVE